jgi:transposase
VATCGKRRRHWTTEQKRQIVAESMEPGVSVATVVRRHGISRGQFYAWRQQLVLGDAIGAAAVTPPRLVGDDVTTTAPCREAALLAALPEADATPVAPVPPGQPDADIVPPSGVAVPVGKENSALKALLQPIVGARSTVRWLHD